jgi:hypothetical protein
MKNFKILFFNEKYKKKVIVQLFIYEFLAEFKIE